MATIESLAAENARLKAVLQQRGFKITYSAATGDIVRISAPRKPSVQHTAINWARKNGYTGSMALVRKITKDKAITERKFKNAVERAELIKDARSYLDTQGYKIPAQFFNKVPTYILKNTDFYENVNAILNSTAEDDGEDLTNETINYSMNTSVDRLRKLNKKSKVKLRLK